MATSFLHCYITHRNIFRKPNILEMIHKCTKVNSPIHIRALIPAI